jgi:hypothetical protein
MKLLLTIAALSLTSLPVCAQTAKPCDDLKAEIAKKIDANGVKSYSLDVMPNDQAKDATGKVVGSCEGGTKKIVYSKTTDTAKAPSSTQTAAAAQPSKE